METPASLPGSVRRWVRMRSLLRLCPAAIYYGFIFAYAVFGRFIETTMDYLFPGGTLIGSFVLPWFLVTLAGVVAAAFLNVAFTGRILAATGTPPRQTPRSQFWDFVIAKAWLLFVLTIPTLAALFYLFAPNC